MKSEKLTLRASQLPNNYYGYDSLEELKSYDASVTAEYTFRNPADYNVKMTLAFSFGKQPYYNEYYDFETGTYASYDDTARYVITAYGEEIERFIHISVIPRKHVGRLRLVRGGNSNAVPSFESSLPFEKGEEVYTYSQQGLPGGELIFTLSTVEYPQKIKQPWWKTFGYFMLFFGIPTIFALVSVGIIVAIIFIITSSAPQKGQ